MFLLGLYFYARTAEPKFVEGLTNRNRCPNMLIQKGTRLYLYNSKIAKIPGVNPIEFDNLEDYVEFLNWQRSQGINCPVLFLQYTYDTQGNPVYITRPGVDNLQGGLPPNPTLLIDASKDDKPYNNNSYPGYDQTSFYVGTTTPLDNMNKEASENTLQSANPMDPNWGGADYTQSLVDKGYYKNNEVQKHSH
jgi:hypothetical protein